MTYEEFHDKLSPFFSGLDIDKLNEIGHNELQDDMGDELTVEECYREGRNYICNRLYECGRDTVEEFIDEFEGIFRGMEITKSNATALMEQFNEEW